MPSPARRADSAFMHRPVVVHHWLVPPWTRVALAVCTCGILVASAPMATARQGADCHAVRTCPAKDGSYAWQPVRGGPDIVCRAITSHVPSAFGQLVDYGGGGYLCRLPTPSDPRAHGTIDFFGPQTVSATPLPLKQDELRLTIDVTVTRASILRVDWGDGSHWQRSVVRSGSFDVTHEYLHAQTYYLLTSLRDSVGYSAIEGVGPFQRPSPGPRARYCRYEAWGKGWTLSASRSLPCAMAQKLFSAYRQGKKLVGYRCRASGLPPYGSDTFVETCVDGSRLWVLTSNP